MTTKTSSKSTDTRPKTKAAPQAVAPPPAGKPPRASHSRMGQRVSLVITVFVVALLGGGIGTWTMTHFSNPLRVITHSQNDGNILRSQSEQDISQVVTKVAPSVVSISTNVENSRGQAVGQGAGTGIIVSKDGYVMTNNHVIDGASTVSITTSAGDIYENVKVIGSDPLNDVAFLKISGVNNLAAAELGDSSTLKIGQSVVAIGNSLGEYNNTVTSGIVSGLNRPVTASSGDGNSTESLTGLVQTDAAINPGNSGGPLVNSAGQVVGINTAVASDAQGIGFAIPINATKGVLASVIENGKVERAYIGVRYVDITPAIAKEKNLPVKQGALVSGDNSTEAVVSGGPADKAGIKDGDIITKINNSVVGEEGSITTIIGQYKPGDAVQVTYLRDGKEQATKLTLAKYEGASQTTTQSQSTQQDEEQSIDPRSLFGF
ncbi:PDZ domain-containing protein [Candidatus Mycosynbacter amalyticus]|uniref:PDZ domain-containing protein n=1 Tax=Candidatus Mycosynbacter amalyticus TaxID=2665156 RepID=A0A857MLM7_9BACT|nr:trypsin-like peptidase domain-containing protein [Candidatus Mycosynbacter amalyticus]QHN42512.1 PDZ domain-containing protein [Candidatus Mycosynbacter amalyticus]